MCGNGIGVHHGGTTTGNHGPHAALGVEDGELQTGARARIELLDVRLLLRQLATEGRGEDLGTMSAAYMRKLHATTHHRRAAVSLNLAANDRLGLLAEDDALVTRDRPLLTDDGLGGLIELRSGVEEVHGRGASRLLRVEDDERVDLEVGEVQVNVDGVEAEDEVRLRRRVSDCDVIA